MANDPQVASGGHPTDVNLEDIFTRTGFCVVPDVLGADEVATMRDALDADRAQHDDWAVHGQSTRAATAARSASPAGGKALATSCGAPLLSTAAWGILASRHC